jgi:hypothetical protein
MAPLIFEKHTELRPVMDCCNGAALRRNLGDFWILALVGGKLSGIKWESVKLDRISGNYGVVS